MPIKLKPNKSLFFIFFLINAAGYNYENSKDGMHKTRVAYRQKAKELMKKDDDFCKLVYFIKSSIPLKSDDYIRLANYVMEVEKGNGIFNNKHINNRIVSSYQKIKNKLILYLNSPIIEYLYLEYIKELKKVSQYNQRCFESQYIKTLSFFHLPENFQLAMNVHVNLLDSFNRGTNYYLGKQSIVSVSLADNSHISWPSFRHECMHIIIKKIYKNKPLGGKIDLPVNRNYQGDSQRVKFEENFILATNLFFIKDYRIRLNNIKYLKDIGYSKINIFHSFIEKNIITEGKSLNTKILNKLIYSPELN